MGKIPFKVSARTAKLIGQENFANADGAIIELVKNCYDADATHCMVFFDIPYPKVPETLSVQEHKHLSSIKGFSASWYQAKGKNYILSQKIREQLKPLQDFLNSQASIYIVDNGTGMNESTILNQWMEIGTGNKEVTFTSDSGRVKTGAKGIGRFALDRLGTQAEVYTYSRQKNNKSGYYWYMDWQQFNQPNKNLTEITAELTEKNTSLFDYIQSSLSQYTKAIGLFKSRAFAGGTIIRITDLKDAWDEKAIAAIFKSLEALVPPIETGVEFNLQLQHLQSPKEYGQVETAYFDDFDYKIEGHYDAVKLKMACVITRNELDMNIVKREYSHLFKGAKAPYDLTSLSKPSVKISKSIFELLTWPKDNDNTYRLQKVGSFSFSFYYLKIRNSSKEEYPNKDFSGSERAAIMEKFGGIKIYRDSFKVRPYGEKGNDWLKLGERVSQSPAGAGQRIGDWRVGPRQIAGAVYISRIANKQIIDKSDRESLVENDSFKIFTSIIIEAIHLFEYDRSVILNKFYKDATIRKENERKKAIQAEAEKLANKMIEERNKVSQKRNTDYSVQGRRQIAAQEKKAIKKIITSGLESFTAAEKDNGEIAQVRALASLGLIVASFSHELKGIKNNAEEIEVLEDIFKQLEPTSRQLSMEYKDGLKIISVLRKDMNKILHWMNYALSSIKSDKRTRTLLNFDTYLKGLKQSWEKALTDRNIQLKTFDRTTTSYDFRANEVDMDTIFSNLISNSVDALNNAKGKRERTIKISVAFNNNNIRIIYEDTGPGLDRVFKKDKDQIFLPFITSKKDKEGKSIGTGLGMYLVKGTVTDYNGTVTIVDSAHGFKLRIDLPARKHTSYEI
ncbi:sensor histidine kinase [Paraflavitalea pollutisoli]|uniref:sensor histidine kinase n=1 Tax=Paraflavitalea pollutisoli TaxID=3034143 RepID=UPI0023EB55A7|nr:sensor histidine kinase [Paraflavitalea sp. H1-2-19X]